MKEDNDEKTIKQQNIKQDSLYCHDYHQRKHNTSVYGNNDYAAAIANALCV